jgi:hypothetical protein
MFHITLANAASVDTPATTKGIVLIGISLTLDFGTAEGIATCPKAGRQLRLHTAHVSQPALAPTLAGSQAPTADPSGSLNDLGTLGAVAPPAKRLKVVRSARAAPRDRHDVVNLE